MQKIIEFIEVNKKFNDRFIYEPDLNFIINRGDKFGIIGKSGAGKSTALNMLMGFLQPEKGKILFENIESSPEVILNFRKKCAWIPQSFNFLKDVSVKNTILKPFLFSSNHKIIPKDDEILHYLSLVKLNERVLESDINELSGGERQRICTVIALLLKREIIILDEPTSNLDSDVSDDVMELFFSSESTVIISTHDKNIYSKCNNLKEIV